MQRPERDAREHTAGGCEYYEAGPVVFDQFTHAAVRRNE